MASTTPLSLTILGHEYRINCPAGAEQDLRDAAQYLNERMLEIKNAGTKGGKVLSIERVAIIAALNVTHRLRDLENGQSNNDEHLSNLHKLLDAALADEQQMQLN